MHKHWGTGFLILCFSVGNVHGVLATQIVEMPPIMVQPYTGNPQTFDQEKINHDQEWVIKQLVEDNQRLLDAALVYRNDAELQRISRIMMKYRDDLVAREGARALVHNDTISKYRDLIRLTEDVDGVKEADRVQALKNDAVEKKYQMLTDLKNEMAALNQKLKNRPVSVYSDKTNAAQEAKIQTLTEKLGKMDERIARYDTLVALKDQQIGQLKERLSKAEHQSLPKDNQENPLRQALSEKKAQVDLLKDELERQIKALRVNQEAQKNLQDKIEDLQRQNASIKEQGVGALKEDLARVHQEDTSRHQALVRDLTVQLSARKEQVGLLKNELEEKITMEKSLENQVVQLQADKERLKGLLAQQQNQIAKIEQLSSGNRYQSAVLADLKKQLLVLKQAMQRQAIDVASKEASILWLNKVLLTLKHKAEYYQLTSEKEHAAMLEIQQQLLQIKDDFIQRSKTYDHLEQVILSFKRQLADKDKTIALLKADNRVDLAGQLIQLQRQETALLVEKNALLRVENQALSNNSAVIEDLKQRRVDVLKMALDRKIAQLQDQRALEARVDDLNTQLQESQERLGLMESKWRNAHQAQIQQDALRATLAQQEDKVERLSKMLADKNTQLDQMAGIMAVYQMKLESKNTVENQVLDQGMRSMNTQLQAKDLSLLMMEQKMDARLNAMSLKYQKMLDEKTHVIKGLKVQLALMRQEPKDRSDADEMDFLRTGLQEATVELKRKDLLIFNLQTSVEEYRKEFKKQSDDFVSVKEQLLKAKEALRNQAGLKKQIGLLNRRLEALENKCIGQK